MSFTDPVAIILIVCALAIFAFLIHGLYFSGRSNNVKLSPQNRQQLSENMTENVAKVRIVETGAHKSVASVSNVVFEESKADTASHTISNLSQGKVDNVAQNVSAEQCPWEQSYEINLVAQEGEYFNGADIEEIRANCGIYRGNMDIFYVYEDPVTRADEVFRICSLEHPYYFPKDMTNYKTRALALYMSLPARGKGYPYFKSLRTAADIFLTRLGGHLEDNYHNALTEEKLNAMAEGLRKYDEQAR